MDSHGVLGAMVTSDSSAIGAYFEISLLLYFPTVIACSQRACCCILMPNRNGLNVTEVRDL